MHLGNPGVRNKNDNRVGSVRDFAYEQNNLLKPLCGNRGWSEGSGKGGEEAVISASKFPPVSTGLQALH